MNTTAGLQARMVWALITSSLIDNLRAEPGEEGAFLAEPPGDYSGLLEGLEARELLALLEQLQSRLNKLGIRQDGRCTSAPLPPNNNTVKTPQESLSPSIIRPPSANQLSPPAATSLPPEPVRLVIDKRYTIRQGSRGGAEVVLRPLVKAIFILFLKHPEGIVLKQRAVYQQELEDIYSVISPSASRESVSSRVGRLVNLQDNSFSEKASVLNSRLEEILPPGRADGYKIHGTNGHPRCIPLASLAVEWE